MNVAKLISRVREHTLRFKSEPRNRKILPVRTLTIYFNVS